MNTDEIWENAGRVFLADGRIGMVILVADAEREAGIQVFGEEDIRWIPFERLAPIMGDALLELDEKRVIDRE